MLKNACGVVVTAVSLMVTASLAAAGSAPASKRLQEGESIYRYACARCHDGGEGGAPVIGSEDGWKSRSNLWEAVLFEHARSGYLAMPAAGGDMRLSDYDVEVACEYMLHRTFPELPGD